MTGLSAPRPVRIGRALTLGALLVALSATVALAANGNNGTLKIHELGTPAGTPNNDPKVCLFNVEGFGLDSGQTGFLVFTTQGGDGPTGADAGPVDFGPALDGYYASEYFQLDPGHYEATLYDDLDLTVKAKSKVFKVTCEGGGGGIG